MSRLPTQDPQLAKNNGEGSLQRIQFWCDKLYLDAITLMLIKEHQLKKISVARNWTTSKDAPHSKGTVNRFYRKAVL